MKNSLIVGTLALSFLCPSSSWAQPKRPEVTTAQVSELSARILLNAKKSYLKGKEVVLGITLENTGTRPLRFHNYDIEFFYEFEVAVGGKKIEPVPEFKDWTRQNLFSHDFILLPQAKRAGFVFLGQAFDLSKEGSYSVVVSKKILQPEGIFTITSQPLDIKITGTQNFGGWGEANVPTTPQPDDPTARQP